jgi:putative PEP-CTERM system histidine kinase
VIVLLGFWTHALAALLYGALALWQLRRWKEDGNRRLVAAFAVTSAWAIFLAFQGPYSLGAGVAEATRNFAFLGFMYAIVGPAADERDQPAVKLVYTVVAAVIGLQLTLAGVMPQFAAKAAVYGALASTAQVLGLTIAAGSLVLVHNLYGQAAHESRWGLRLPTIALAGMWAYDLHLYTVAWLTRGPVDDLYAMRGAIVSMLVPLFALASRRSAGWRMQLSRAATFQSLSLIAILGYLILMMTASRALEVVGGNWVRIGQVGLVFAITVAAVILLPSGRMRAWSRVIVAKHFFEHRYDYREEWLRFTRTVGGDAPLGERIIKAIADIAESRSGLLLVPEGGRLSVAARWNWRDDLPEASADDANLVAFLEKSGHVLDFTTLRSGAIATGEAELRAPAGLAAIDSLWAGVPLIHGDRLVGLVLLEHPLVRRALDWEDFDLFRTVGIQAASYLAEAHTQDALADARRFDEFNRRFAFIIHDIKNLVSQLSLIIRNAERHADKAEFREDMIATLRSSVKKMNDLLAGASHSARPGGGHHRRGQAAGSPRRTPRGPEYRGGGGSPTPGAGARPSRPERDRREPVGRTGRDRVRGARARGGDRDRRPRRGYVRRLHPHPAVPALRLDQGMRLRGRRLRGAQPGRGDGRPDRGGQPPRRGQPLHCLFTAG